MLLSDIKQKINDGEITTWIVDSDGDITHKSDQWKYKAWFHPQIEENRLVLAIWGRKSANMSVEEYAAYHGKFLRMILVHFDKQMDGIEISPLASKYDNIFAEKEQSDKTE